MSEIAEKTPVVTLTENARAKLREMRDQEPDRQEKSLRLVVERGGCSGMQYAMEFTQPQPGDLHAEFDGVAVSVEPGSAAFLQGSEIDYEESLTEVGFKIRNPNARLSCGCGKSFTA